MAKKKSSNKGINLLKGITGSKLAKLATLVIVLLAIPITVLMSQNQQNTSQEAAKSSCQKMGGYCINTDFANQVSRCKASGRTILKGLCPGAANIQCCVKPSLTTTTKAGTTKKTCIGMGGNSCECKEPRGGKCITDTAPSYSNCARSGGKVSTGYCHGKTYCCVPQGTDKCMDIGHCQYTNVPCPSGKWKSGLCPGASNFKCCLDK